MGEFVTAQAARERCGALLAVIDDAHTQLRRLPIDLVGNEFRAELAERLETQQRTNRGLMYRVFGLIAHPPEEAGMARSTVNGLAARLRVPPREIKRRLKLAVRLCPRRQLSGPPLPPELTQLAAAVEAGRIGEDHLKVITTALDALPSAVCPQDRADAQTSLVREATRSDADIVTAAARRIDDILNPDGDYDDADRARRRGLHLSPQGRDGMSRLAGYLDPEARAYLEAVSAAVRPGRHRPEATIEDTTDDRSPAQRCHDGLALALKIALSCGGLGSHRGHPVTVIARTTLAELNQAAHAVTDPEKSMPPPARTGGHGTLPMRDLIRMAADAIHYLAVFDDHSERPLYLARQTRIATTDQRIICYARDGRLHPAGLHRTRLPQRGPPHPRLAPRRPHRCRLPALRLPTRPPTHHRRPLPHHRHQHRQTGLDRRHRPTPHQPPAPPRRTPAQRHRPTRRRSADLVTPSAVMVLDAGMEFRRTRTIAAEPQAIWTVLADFGGLASWAGNVDHSCLLHRSADGAVGTTRRVQAGRQTLVERITEFAPPERLAYAIEGLPRRMGRLSNSWELLPAANDATVVTLTSTVESGRRLVDRIVGRLMTKQSDAMLTGLAEAMGVTA